MDEAQRANFIGQIIQNMAFEVKRCGGKSIPAIMEQARSSTISAVDSQSQFLEVYAELLKEYWEQSQPGTNASQQALQSLKQLLHQKTIPESYARAIVEDLQGWLGQDSLLAFILPILVFETIIAEDIHTDISRKIPPIPMDATVPVVKMFETILKRKAHWGPGSRAYFLDVMLRIIEADQEFSREKVAQLERAIHCLQLYVVGAPVATIAIQQYFSLCAEDNLTIQLPALLNEKIAKETPITHLKATWYATQKEKEDGALPHNLPLCEKCAVVFQPRLESVLRCWLLERSTASGERNVRGGSSDGAACEPTDGVDGGTGGGQVGGSMGLGRNDVNV
ncbi:hypothetical protein HK104_010021 [Borealophlyctis nickersoniae]|nr:hypothetical protein HK104_010021 [Borealophlyctis nickersoniae]